MVDQVRAPASEAHASAATPPVADLSSPGAIWRLLITGCILVLLALGTLVGTDDDWPFGPLRQYATASRVSGLVLLTHVYGVHPSGRTVRLNTEALGMRVAELDGQLARLRRHPELLLSLATAYHRKHPDRAPLVRLVLQRDGKRTRDRKVVEEIHRVEAQVEVP